MWYFTSLPTDELHLTLILVMLLPSLSIDLFNQRNEFKLNNEINEIEERIVIRPSINPTRFVVL